MPRRQRQTATYFRSLELENVRCFGESQKLDLTDKKGNLSQWTLILGDNGAGKTTMLQCLVWMRPVLVDERPSDASDTLAPLDKAILKGKLGSALPEEENNILERLLRIGGAGELCMKAEVVQDDDLNFGTPPHGKKIKTEIKVIFDEKGHLESFKPIRTDIEKNFENGFWDPFIVAYGANRQIGSQNVTNSELEDPLARRLSDVTELYDAEERLTILDHAATDKKYRRGKRNGAISAEERLLETFKRAIADILPDEHRGPGRIEIEAPKLEGGELKESVVKLQVNEISVPLSDLSLGFKTTLAWALDLSWRLFNRYPKSAAPLEEPAIVLIDELDLHLHPRWQREIMGKLASVFKRTQFIATAHSPLMVQSMPNANFAVVRMVDNQAIIENEPETVKGWRVDQILNSEYFGIRVSRPPDEEKLFKERSDLSLKARRSAAEEARLRELEEQILKLPTDPVPQESESVELLRKATQLLEAKKTKK
jgi:hypothetical protein